MRADRLLQTAADVRCKRENPNTLEMSFWRGFSAVACGTAACAVGTHIDAHPGGELRWVGTDGGLQAPAFGHLHDWEAVETYYELTPAQAYHLFDGSRYPMQHRSDPDYVAQRIEAYVAAHREPERIEMKPEQQAVNAAVE